MEYYGTLGPSCCKKEVLKEMIKNGMTGIRLNLSHKSLQESEKWITSYIDACKECDTEVDLLMDLQGPELRIEDIIEELDIKDNVYIGPKGIPVPNHLYDYFNVGQTVLIDDGKIELEIIDIQDKDILCKVIHGGVLTSRKSIKIVGVKTKQPTLTDKDIENIKHANTYQVKDVMLPFVRNKEDLITLRQTLQQYDCSHIRIFAKIEDENGVKHIDELIPYCDVIVIARGDLGNAIPLTKLPTIQDKIASICKQNNREFMVVTQMLNSMISSPVPTRAEVSDIFLATMQGAHSIMLTGETAAGKYPIEAIKILVDTANEAIQYLNK